MKNYLSTFLILLCVVLVVVIVLIERNNSTQHANDVSAFETISNQLSSAQDQIVVQGGAIFTLSNNLAESQSASVTFSNQWMDVKSAAESSAKKITDLDKQIAELQSENQSLGQQIPVLTNQIIELEKKNALTEAALAEANKNYSLLENRLQRDVAERMVVERKFNNFSEVQIQLQKLKQGNSPNAISAESIYSGLDLEVKSNGVVRVIAPD